MVHSDGNFLSILVFFLWVPFALWGAKRWPAPKAASLLLLLPLMFLPERVEFDLPLLPPFGKTEVAMLWAAIALGLPAGGEDITNGRHVLLAVTGIDYLA